MPGQDLRPACSESWHVESHKKTKGICEEPSRKKDQQYKPRRGRRRKRKSPLKWFCAYFNRTCTVPEYPLIKTKCLLLNRALPLLAGNAHRAPMGAGARPGRLISPPGINSILKVRACSWLGKKKNQEKGPSATGLWGSITPNVC